MGNLKNRSTPIPQFDAPDVPIEPTQLRQGDTWNWERAFPDYPSNLYQLKYVFNSSASRFVLDGTLATNPPITSDTDGQTFDIQAPSTLTATCQPDTYQLVAILIGIADTTAAGEQVTMPLQDVLVEANLATATGPVDTRSFVKKRLDMIEDCINGDTRPDVQEYMINGRQLKKIPPAELEKLRVHYKSKYRAELRAQGEYAGRRVIGFRFRPTC
jgi:hypothetical protein